MKTKVIGLTVVVILLGMLLTGVVSAGSSVSLVGTGLVHVESSYSDSTQRGLPYDATDYNLDVFAVGSNQVDINHTLNSAGGLEVETTLKFVPATTISSVFVDESLRKQKIETTGNDSLCFDASAGTKSSASSLLYESASIVSDTNMGYAVNALGEGNVKYASSEFSVTGDVTGDVENKTWVKKDTRESVAVRSGFFDLTAEYTNDIPAFPAAEGDDDWLCPFGKGV